MSKNYAYIVEHLDPEFEAWQSLEYKTIAHECATSGIASFTLSGLQQEAVDKAPAWWRETMREHWTSRNVEDLVTERYGSYEEGKKRVCLLDPKAEKDLGPGDGEDFDVFVFGGILGDDPPRDRTSELRAKGFAGRRLGEEQMTTDTAARVTRIVVQDKVALNDIKYIDRPDIEVNANETTSMPFKYVDNGKGQPIMPEGMLDLLASDADKGILDLL
ncbi:hypothetical protein MBLNU230_g0691t1 [Neophaeotheca triangularis]